MELACDISLNSILPPELRARYQDPDVIRRVLREARTIAIVGISTDKYKASHMVGAYLQYEGYRIIPVNPNATEILGRTLLSRPVKRTGASGCGGHLPPRTRMPRHRATGNPERCMVRLDAAAHCESGGCRDGGTRRANRDYGPLYQNGAWSLQRQLALGRDEYRNHHCAQAAKLYSLKSEEVNRYDQNLLSAC
jgi:hypothetical protein